VIDRLLEESAPLAPHGRVEWHRTRRTLPCAVVPGPRTARDGGTSV